MHRHSPALLGGAAVVCVAVLTGCGSQSTSTPAASSPPESSTAASSTAASSTAPSSTAPSSTAPSSTAPSSTAPSSTGTTIAIALGADGKVTPPTARYEVAAGTELTITATCASACELHVHGYDLESPSKAGVARLTFTPENKGLFEVEDHESGKPLFQIAAS